MVDMHERRRVLVTGATGNAGREVVRALRELGLEPRAGARLPERARVSLGPDVEIVPFDFRRPDGWVAALEGCEGVFLLRPPAIADTERTLCPFIDVARSMGGIHIVFLSVAGAESNRFVPHHAVEKHLAATGDDFTILRPGFFAQNLGDAYRLDIVEDDRLYVPAGRGRVAFVDLHDVADVAASVFLDPTPHRGLGYTLTGPEAVSFEEAAALLGESLGRPVRYEPASVLGYIAHLRRRRGLGWMQSLVQTVLHLGIRRGHAAEVDPTLGRLLGRPARQLGTYVSAHQRLFSVAAPSRSAEEV